ncbi:endo-1,3-1,4-beta-d-glucanase [Fagus crenata]
MTEEPSVIFVFDYLCSFADLSRRRKSRRMVSHQCCSNPPTLDPSSGVGHIEQLGGLSTYVTGSSSAKHAIILTSDIFGYEAPKLRKLADEVAAAGYYVVVPDFIREPFVLENIAILPLEVWMKDHGTDKGFEESKLIIETLRSKGATAVGAAGFCWGGKVVSELSKYELIEASVLLHPTWVTVDDIKGAKVPISILGAEIDNLCPPELLKQYEEVLTAQSKVDGFVKIFPKVAHGWTVRYSVEDAAAVKSAEEAHMNLLEWFAQFVK